MNIYVRSYQSSPTIDVSSALEGSTIDLTLLTFPCLSFAIISAFLSPRLAPASLWAILKGSIGKDLTKISFPVFFNEPTSMLQRMSEDMEFSDCLDNAVAERDPTKRIAHVAAFAMSNYSSTIGRIAKPFNPMLSETFEYVDIKKQYRYIGEQVSHHPPISAAIAQSPNWEFLCSTFVHSTAPAKLLTLTPSRSNSNSDAKSKFTGKSFEITPVGIASVTLRIPQEWDTSLPPAKGRFPGMVEEKYSWKKVTTSVSNLLFTPVIDHFGEMVGRFSFLLKETTQELITLSFL